jgi:hypothetical protein
MANAAALAALESPRFQGILLSLRLRSLEHDLPSLKLSAQVTEVDWNFALLCASALTRDDSEAAQIAVLRVASGCLMDESTTEEQRLAAAALLERDGNSLAVQVAEDKGYVDPGQWLGLPIALQLEVISSKLRHSVALSTGKPLAVNGFQGALWADASSYRWLSVSAPTSSGKSRILREWFLEQLRTNDRYSAVYLVPTRALVEEVSGAFRKFAQKRTSVFMMPWDKTIHSATSRVLVLTQERLHLIQTTHPDFKVDLLFVDEAQGLGAAHRGILLQQVIDRTATANPDVQVLFASPLSANPGLLLEDLPPGSSASSFTSETVTVNQNLLRIEPTPGNRASKNISLVHGGEPLHIGSIDLPDRPEGVFKTIAAISYSLGREHGGNIVYANGPDDAEKTSQAIVARMDGPTLPLDPEIVELQSLIRTAVHPDYVLIEVLRYGVAFHYGNMPLAIRAEIERLFEADKLRFLICTSTLLEGVNLPCKNIFIRAPRKGRGNPMTELDFWNLAGRAGRWGKEFQGNVICIDTQNAEAWPNLPTVRGQFELKRAVSTGLREPDGLVNYLRTGSDLKLELGTIADQKTRDAVTRRLDQVLDTFELPVALIPRHAGISPISMTKLLENFKASGRSAKSLALPNPTAADAKEAYQSAYVRVGATMTTAFGNPPASGLDDDDKRKWQIAALVINWMKGMPLARLIEQRVSYAYPLPRAIRDVMSDIETIVRFQSAKYLACYNDVLAAYAELRGETFADADFDVSMMLELGVSRPSQVTLMSLGLSRTATIAISGLIGPDEWSPELAMTWLRSTNFGAVDIPVVLKREISSLIADPNE